MLQLHIYGIILSFIYSLINVKDTINILKIKFNIEIDSNRKVIHRYLYIITIIKWLSVILLTIKTTKTTNPVIQFTIFLYSLGDAMIIWNQDKSIIFFILGHLNFLWYIYLQTIQYNTLIYITIISIISTSIILYLLIRLNRITDNEYQIYFAYIMMLHFYLLMPIIIDGYFGTFLFIISDVIIGFKIKYYNMEYLDWPLYYTSILLLQKYY